jgi:hypothetical protein
VGVSKVGEKDVVMWEAIFYNRDFVDYCTMS